MKDRTEREASRPKRLDGELRQKRLSWFDNDLAGKEDRKSEFSNGVPRDSSTLSVHDGTMEGPLLERVVHSDNLANAWKNVRRNRGSPGVDGMTVSDFPQFWERHGDSIRAKLLAGTYRPSPVKRVTIPKPDGGERLLGVPTVLDRVIQQAILQVLQPLIDPSFSEHSYGFRPGRNAHDAVRAAQRFVEAGYTWVVDLDVEKFFDQVNHDVLMHRVSLRVRDKRLLRLTRLYLQAGVMVMGVKVASEEGTPQGGPLSPFLANILLDDLDQELEARGHRFVRYADDCNIYVRTEASGQRVFASISRFLEMRLRLRVNREKSAVDRPWNRKFLGFSFLQTRNGLRLCVSREAMRDFRHQARLVLSRARGERLTRSIEELNRFLRGWFQYFKIAEHGKSFQDLDGWVRRRFRCVKWRQWKRPRTRVRELLRLGVPGKTVRSEGSSRGAWRMSASLAMHWGLGVSFFRAMGLFSLFEEWPRPLDTF